MDVTSRYQEMLVKDKEKTKLKIGVFNKGKQKSTQIFVDEEEYFTKSGSWDDLFQILVEIC